MDQRSNFYTLRIGRETIELRGTDAHGALAQYADDTNIEYSQFLRRLFRRRAVLKEKPPFSHTETTIDILDLAARYCAEQEFANTSDTNSLMTQYRINRNLTETGQLKTAIRGTLISDYKKSRGMLFELLGTEPQNADFSFISREGYEHEIAARIAARMPGGIPYNWESALEQSHQMHPGTLRRKHSSR